MEAQSLIPMAVTPCSLSRSLTFLTPRLPSSFSLSSPLHGRRQYPRRLTPTVHPLRPSAQLSRSYDADFREPPTGPKDTFFEILHDSNKEQSVMLRFVWLEKSLGLALDQVIPDYGTIPLTPYYFIPQKDAVGELEKFIESQGWISRNRTSAILRQAADLISLWQEKAV